MTAQFLPLVIGAPQIILIVIVVLLLFGGKKTKISSKIKVLQCFVLEEFGVKSQQTT